MRILIFRCGTDFSEGGAARGPVKNRSCTDVLCLLIFVAFLAGWGIVGYFGKYSSTFPFLLLYPLSITTTNSRLRRAKQINNCTDSFLIIWCNGTCFKQIFHHFLFFFFPIWTTLKCLEKILWYSKKDQVWRGKKVEFDLRPQVGKITRTKRLNLTLHSFVYELYVFLSLTWSQC